MGLFDFLGGYAVNPTAGTPGVAAQPMMPSVNDPGGLGVQAAVPGKAAIPATAGKPGLTYGDIAATLMKYGSKPGSSGSMIGQGLQGVYGASAMGQQQPSGQLQDFGPTAQQQQKQKSADSAGQVLRFFTSMFGV